MSKPENKVFKIIVLGPAKVGKTNLVSRYLKDQFTPEYKATIACDFAYKEKKLNCESIMVQIFDVAGKEHIKPIGSLPFKGCQGVIIAFDVSDPEWQKKIAMELRMLQLKESILPKNLPILLVGTKLDVENTAKVDRVAVEAFVATLNYRSTRFHIDDYIETSAATGHNVSVLFDGMVDLINSSRNFEHTIVGPEAQPTFNARSGNKRRLGLWPNNSSIDDKQAINTFVTAYQDQLDLDNSKYCCLYRLFSRSRIKNQLATIDLETILENAKTIGSRTRQVCVNLNWINALGDVVINLSSSDAKTSVRG